MSDLDSTRPQAAPIRLTLLTGFLGAGKTTILNRLLSEPDVVDTAVIVNEFGEIGIDEMLVEAEVSDGLIELSDGCLCCSVRGELVDTLERLAGRRANGRRLARVVIETTGLADPTPILGAIMTHPVLGEAYRLDGIVCVVDAINGAHNLSHHVEARRQLAVADRIVLTKTDLGEAAERGALERMIGDANPFGRIVEPGAGGSLAATLLDCGLSKMAGGVGDPHEWLGGDHRHDHDHDHDHGTARSGHNHGGIRSMALTRDEPIGEEALLGFLDLLAGFEGGNILRMKGIVHSREHPDRPLVLHGVRGFLHPPARLDRWREGHARQSRLVIIGEDLNERRVRDLFAAFTGEVRIDAPDRQALDDNPLAVPGATFR